MNESVQAPTRAELLAAFTTLHRLCAALPEEQFRAVALSLGYSNDVASVARAVNLVPLTERAALREPVGPRPGSEFFTVFPCGNGPAVVMERGGGLCEDDWIVYDGTRADCEAWARYMNLSKFERLNTPEPTCRSSCPALLRFRRSRYT